MTEINITAAAPARPSRFWIDLAERGALVAIILAILLVGSLFSPRILTPGNMANIVTQASYLMLFATAQMVVIIARGFDLSLGVAVSTISVCAALIMTNAGIPAGFGVPLALLGALAIGLAIGGFNGIAVALGRVNPFIVTLGTMNILLAVSSTISGGFPVSPLPSGFNLLASGQILGIPVQVLIVGAVLLITHGILSATVFGRSLYLTGSNPRAAAVAGIPVRRILILTYMLCTGIIAVGALLLTARTGSGEPNLGGNLTLETIAAAVLGGASLHGGRGGIMAPILGALLVTVLSNVMNLTNVDGFIQQILLGLTIILALSIDRLRAAV
jgi:ribose transport system permease protein